MVSVWLKIRYQENRISRFDVTRNILRSQLVVEQEQAVAGGSLESKRRSLSMQGATRARRSSVQSTTKKRNHSIRFAVQGSLYVGIMVLCNVWWIIGNIIRSMNDDRQGNIYVSAISVLLRPWEGFFLLLVYLR